MKLSTAVHEFLIDSRLRLRPATIGAYESDLELLIAIAKIHATDTVFAFTGDLARRYFNALSEKNLAMSTLHRRRASLSEFAKWGQRRRLWAENPMADVQPIKRPRNLPRPFTHEERQRLMDVRLDSAAERVARAILFWTGMRVSEVCGLQLQDIAEGDGTTLGTVRVRGKGNKERVVPMVPELRAIVHDYLWTYSDLDPRSFLLHQKLGKPWTRKMLWMRVRAWGVAANVVKCTVHRWRHTTATMLLERGAGLREVQEWLGHADINTTVVYTQVTAQRLMDTARLLSGEASRAHE